MHLDLQPLQGKCILQIEKKDWTWFFLLSDGNCVVTEQGWRLVTVDGILVTSEDHGQQFGLPAPVDAATLAKDILKLEPIVDANHDLKTGDLLFRFSDEKYIQFLQMSSGHESWRLHINGKEFICLGGGEYASFDR